jgi:hypothetical protein
MTGIRTLVDPLLTVATDSFGESEFWGSLVACNVLSTRNRASDIFIHQPKTAAEAYESVMHARKMLPSVHWVLGILSAISLWPLLPVRGVNTATSGIGILTILQTILGWAPYVVSGFYARSVLDGNYRGVIAFTIGAILITVLSVGFYLNIFRLPDKPNLVLISICVTLGLLALARLCQVIWHKSVVQ